MKSIGMLVVKAIFAAVLVLLAAGFAGKKLPAMLVIGGKDMRPIIGGAAVLAVLMWLGKPGGPAVPIVDKVIAPAA